VGINSIHKYLGILFNAFVDLWQGVDVVAVALEKNK
jgi:hypothetical protein